MSEDFGKLLLRAIAGGFLLPHGLGKLAGWFGGPGLQGFVQELAGFGLPASLGLAVTLALIQTLSGALVLVGLYTRGAAMVAAGFLMGTAWLAVPNGWYWFKQGLEFPLFWTGALVAVALLGPGAASLDSVRGGLKRGP